MLTASKFSLQGSGIGSQMSVRNCTVVLAVRLLSAQMELTPTVYRLSLARPVSVHTLLNISKL